MCANLSKYDPAILEKERRPVERWGGVMVRGRERGGSGANQMLGRGAMVYMGAPYRWKAQPLWSGGHDAPVGSEKVPVVAVRYVFKAWVPLL